MGVEPNGTQETIPTDGVIKINLRSVLTNNEIELDLPLQTSASEIIDAIVNNPETNIPRTDPQGNPYTFKLKCKETGAELQTSQTLMEANIKNNYTLLLVTQMIAGFYNI